MENVWKYFVRRTDNALKNWNKMLHSLSTQCTSELIVYCILVYCILVHVPFDFLLALSISVSWLLFLFFDFPCSTKKCSLSWIICWSQVYTKSSSICYRNASLQGLNVLFFYELPVTFFSGSCKKEAINRISRRTVFLKL